MKRLWAGDSRYASLPNYHVTSKAYKSLGLLRRIFIDIYCPAARKALYISITRSTLRILTYVE